MNGEAIGGDVGPWGQLSTTELVLAACARKDGGAMASSCTSADKHRRTADSGGETVAAVPSHAAETGGWTALEIPSPPMSFAGKPSLLPPPLLGVALLLLFALISPGVFGDSVPILELLAPERGVICPFNRDITASFWPKGIPRNSSLRGVEAGEDWLDPASLGAKGLLVLRKCELRAGVSGLTTTWLFCLSSGIVHNSDMVKGVRWV